MLRQSILVNDIAAWEQRTPVCVCCVRWSAQCNNLSIWWHASSVLNIIFICLAVIMFSYWELEWFIDSSNSCIIIYLEQFFFSLNMNWSDLLGNQNEKPFKFKTHEAKLLFTQAPLQCLSLFSAFCSTIPREMNSLTRDRDCKIRV